MNDSQATRILIADDHTIVREGLAAIIRLQPDLRVAGEAADGEAAIVAFEEHLPDVMLLDLRMPKLQGLEVVRAIRSRHREARIVIVTTYDSDEDIFLCLKAGASGYLLKDAPRQEILDAIRAVHAGDHYIPAHVATKMAEHLARPELTERETETLRLIAVGKSNKEIGTAMFISEGTVKTHVKSVLAKLDAMSRTEAVAIATRRGLVRL
jgi:two-component system NarL family response regulator